jgi:pimeloyl-ACP methyl ester carboxylesterase
LSGRSEGASHLHLQVKQFDAGLVKISYAEGPASGRPLILLHGLARNWRDFLALIPQLSRRWHVYAIDLRGHGASGRVARGYQSRSYAADVVGFLQEIAGEPAVLFGHSLGGMTAMHIAAECPELVQAVILGDNLLSESALAHGMYPVLFAGLLKLILRGGSVPELAKGLATIEIPVPGFDHPIAIGELPGNDPAYLRAWAECLQQVDPEALAMTLDGSTQADFDAEALLQAIPCPTLILQANPDLGGLMSHAEVQRAMQLLAQPQLVSFPLLGHALHLQQPQPVLKAVTSFLELL